MLIAGWSDASSGPLIPYIQVSRSTVSLLCANADSRLQAYYGISYTVVSMLFVGKCAPGADGR